MRIHPNDWKAVIFLPIEGFMKKDQELSKETAFKDSLKKLKKKQAMNTGVVDYV